MKIYRYRTLNNNTFDELVSGETWHSKFSELNDPFEGIYLDRTNGENLSELLSCLSICCFSRNRNSLLMWAHYADCHRGICIEYDVDEETFNTSFMKVEYSNQMPVLNKLTRYPEGSPQAGKLCVNINREGLIFRTKSPDWGYEEEYRVIRVTDDPTKSGQLSLIKGDISAIFFGLRADQRHISLVNKLLQDREQIEFQQAKLPNNQYNLEFSRIDRGKI